MANLRSQRVRELVGLQEETPEKPYSILHRLALATAYKNLGYPDLAAGDAYKALLLVDEVSEETEYHEEALEAAGTDFRTRSRDGSSPATEDELLSWVRSECLRRAYVSTKTFIDSLLNCGCLRNAFDYIQRAKKAFPQEQSFTNSEETLSQKVLDHSRSEGKDFANMDIDDYPNKSLVRRENYPWNDHEPDRYSEECIEYLAEELEIIAPKLEVKIVELPLLSSGVDAQPSGSQIIVVKQLGLFAKEDIQPGERILEEKSLLTAISRLHDTYCDACSVLLPDSRDDGNELVSCEECDEVFFCSTECHDLAQDNYHPSLCGVSLSQEKVPAREAADNLYALLLIRALALAETRNAHPLDLKEVRYIWGDYHGSDLDTEWHTDSKGHLSDPFSSVPRTLQFSFTNNVLAPLHALEKMDVNIFTQSHRYDTWVFNVLFAKFRGTASAQQGLDGRPEIGAVHPMWCLANHSCDPNVAWKWEGSMRFWTREHPVDWQGRDPMKSPGLSKGEEVLSHYCDVTLPVKERREWAIGALGGECMCERCLWEASQEGNGNSGVQ